MYIADCLSRAQVLDVEEDAEMTTVVHSIIKRACLREDNFIFYKECLERDETLSRICGFIENNWPGYHKLDKECQEFYRMKNELHYEKGVLFFGNKLVIPKELQGRIVKQLHGPHLGVEKTRGLAS